MPRAPVLPKVKSLPGTQTQSAVDDGDTDGDVGQNCFNVRRHIVRAFCGVGIQAIIFWHQAI